MDALSFLRSEHESVLGMIESLERGRGNSQPELDARNHLTTSLVMAASQHEAVEEQFFWPAVRQSLPDGDALADQGINQEESGKQLLQMIEDSEAGNEQFEQALTEFLATLREHIEFEQSQVWPQFRKSQPPQAMEELGQKMAAAKKTAPTRPHPDTPSSSGVQKTVGPAAAVADKARDMFSGRRSHQPPDPPS
ncbi:hemerythrin domain-containing protein [Nocardia donostiensis]|uniref:Hemerythrin n=1 Tax=Nocardia donostiensis TaxID=1538463 RepID=A0A1V2TEQ7_9NOCA|nr:hemerythrin domain-containing protein [Nocardia donostiensis]ONM47985.1 hemerythrin [Nocardia donostiensis]OQS13102.1 hemerythrin [Nocardia donostiensis]OQS21528.1 hemerythrin [Nocardia donostiensis]